MENRRGGRPADAGAPDPPGGDPKPKLIEAILWAREDFKAKGMDRLGEDEADWIAEVILNRFRVKPMEGEDIGDAYEEPND